MRTNSIRFKTGILYSVILFLILAVFSWIILFFVRQILYLDLDRRLHNKASEIASLLEASDELALARFGSFVISRKSGTFIEATGAADGSRHVIDNLLRAEVEAISLREDYINVFDKDRQAFLFLSNYPQEFDRLLRKMCLVGDKEIWKTVQVKKAYFRFINYPFIYKDSSHCVIAIGSPVTNIRRIMNRLVLFMLAGVILIVITTSFLGQFLASRILKPVAEVARTANNISHQELSVRIPVEQIDAEMKYLVDSFNSMIDRLQKAFGHINEFSSQVAHELKTPLAIVKGEIELALERDRSPAEYKRVLRENLDDVNRIIKTIQDLFLLAKLDYRKDIFKFEQVDFLEFFTEVCEHARVLSSVRKINFTGNFPSGRFIVKGDKVHLYRLFSNILDNAVKFTPVSGDIGVCVSAAGENIKVDIRDSGEGIPEEYRPKIFDKFSHVPIKNRDRNPGIGLGLSIAKSIAIAHGGDIAFQNNPDRGCTFTVILPLEK